MKQIALWVFVVIWFFHLLLGAGGGYAILRLWANRSNPLICRLAIFMHGTPIGALVSIVLVFVAKGVHLTWKFTLVWFIGTFLMDAVRVPLVLYLVRGGTSEMHYEDRASGAMPLEYWNQKFEWLGKKIDELKK